jgi:ParB family chromosome partitioning protein
VISSEYDHVELGSIVISGANPRKTFSDESLRELADSIREHGILEPLVVRQGAEPDTYELVAGERRLRAAKLAGWKMAPVVIRDLTDEAAAEIMLIENLQREDLAPLEVATALQQLLAGGSTQADLGKRLGKSQSWILSAWTPPWRRSPATSPPWMTPPRPTSRPCGSAARCWLT